MSNPRSVHFPVLPIIMGTTSDNEQACDFRRCELGDFKDRIFALEQEFRAALLKLDAHNASEISRVKDDLFERLRNVEKEFDTKLSIFAKESRDEISQIRNDIELLKANIGNESSNSGLYGVIRKSGESMIKVSDQLKELQIAKVKQDAQIDTAAKAISILCKVLTSSVVAALVGWFVKLYVLHSASPIK